MRHHMLLLFPVLLPMGGAFCQIDYFGNRPEWRLAHSVRPGTCLIVTEYAYYVMGDTMLDGTEYRIIGKRGYQYERNVGTPPGCTSYLGDFRYPYAYLRQEGRSMRQWSFGADLLVYDHALGVGDTIPASALAYPGEVVVAVDSILLGGIHHRVLRLDLVGPGGAVYPIELIEGVGHVRDNGPESGELLDPYGPMLSPTVLLCYARDGMTHWTSPFTDPMTCDYLATGGINEPRMVASPVVHPNPFSDGLWIEPAAAGVHGIRVQDMSGRTLVEQAGDGQRTHWLELHHLAPGAYVVIVSSATDRYTVRVVKG